MAAVTTTKVTDVINPQVMGDMIEAKIAAQNKLIPYAKVDDSLEGVPGGHKNSTDVEICWGCRGF